jgi:hypothetical protein
VVSAESQQQDDRDRRAQAQHNQRTHSERLLLGSATHVAAEPFNATPRLAFPWEAPDAAQQKGPPADRRAFRNLESEGL